MKDSQPTMQPEDYRRAQEYWQTRDATASKMPPQALRQAAETFLAAHNTCALATASGGASPLVRCTPLEYCWLENALCILSEGGQKFGALEKNKAVCAAVFEPYAGFGSLASIQISGRAQVLKFGCEAYRHVLAFKKIPQSALKKLDHPLYLIRVVPQTMELLFSDFSKQGYASRQRLNWEGEA